jgi:hypothetical protein
MLRRNRAHILPLTGTTMKARVFHKKLPEVLDYALGIVISSIPGMRNKIRLKDRAWKYVHRPAKTQNNNKT